MRVSFNTHSRSWNFNKNQITWQIFDSWHFRPSRPFVLWNLGRLLLWVWFIGGKLDWIIFEALNVSGVNNIQCFIGDLNWFYLYAQSLVWNVIGEYKSIEASNQKCKYNRRLLWFLQMVATQENLYRRKYTSAANSALWWFWRSNFHKVREYRFWAH